MKASLAAGIVVLIALGGAGAAWAHGKDRVRNQLRDEGYKDIEITGAKPPFEVSACRGGERFRLRIDYYGKKTGETSVGSCNGEASAAPPASSTAPAQVPVKKADCKRYIPAAGMTISVPCTEKK